MLDRKEKQVIIDSVKGDIAKCNAVFITNLVGAKATEATKTRKDVRDAGGKIVITRNTFFGKAAIGTHLEKSFTSFKGTTAVAFSFKDAAAVARVLKDAGKEQPIIDLRGGFLGIKELSVNEVLALADLPSRDQMLGTLLATFMAPASAFVRVLNAIKEQKETSTTV